MLWVPLTTKWRRKKTLRWCASLVNFYIWLNYFILYNMIAFLLVSRLSQMFSHILQVDITSSKAIYGKKLVFHKHDLLTFSVSSSEPRIFILFAIFVINTTQKKTTTEEGEAWGSPLTYYYISSQLRISPAQTLSLQSQ